MNKPTHKKRHCDAPTFFAIPQKGSGSRLAEARDDGQSDAAHLVVGYYAPIQLPVGSDDAVTYNVLRGSLDNDAGFGLGNTSHGSSGYANWVHRNTVSGHSRGVSLKLGSHFQLIEDNEFDSLSVTSGTPIGVLVEHDNAKKYNLDEGWIEFGSDFTVVSGNTLDGVTVTNGNGLTVETDEDLEVVAPTTSESLAPNLMSDRQTSPSGTSNILPTSLE